MIRRAIAVILVTLSALAAPVWLASHNILVASAQPGGAPPNSQTPSRPGMPGMPPAPGGEMRPGAPPFAFAAADSFAAERDSLMNLVLDRIADREDSPAESVFKNIKVMKDMTAGHLVRAMNYGYGRSLGVPCQFCHVEGHWADDDKKPKAIARDMMEMTRAINADLVPKMKSLADEHVFINCGTCHQGHHKPPRMMGGRPPGGPPGGDPLRRN